MIAETRRVAFTARQWEAYEFVLEFHRMRHRTPNAQQLSRGLGIPLVESANLISALTAKGVLRRRVYHELAVVPPSYHSHELVED